MLLAPWFALAGLIAAAGPILIHLLNRRRFKVVQWAAMDFLREAIQRSKRILHIRDLLLLILRTACVLLFGLALARPLFAPAGGRADPDQPVHAIVLLDNSLSMSYQELDRTLLEQAKLRARQWIEHLPSGSRISLVPLCGSTAGASLDAYSTKEDALEALAAIEFMDRAASAAGAIDLAIEASRRVMDMPNKKIVLIGDAQITSTPLESLSSQLARLPVPIETIRVAATSVENAWVSDFKLQDGIADPQTPAEFLATIRYQGVQPRHDVQVTLTVDGANIATQTVDLLPGQAREIRFPPCRLAVAAEPGQPRFVSASVSIAHDRLPADDQRFLVFPVVASVPVVFIDQYGDSEDPRHNLLGETWSLRRLLAPVTSTEENQRHLIQIRHVTADRVSRDLLADARLVVIAGIGDPGAALPMLQEYVGQGGSLLIAAGGVFDPAAWTSVAWRDGLGLLPAPLRSAFVGRSPDESGGPIQPFQLNFQSLVHEYFHLDQTSREELEDLYNQPWFFKAAVPEVDEKTLTAAVQTVSQKIRTEQDELTQLDQQLAKLGGQSAGQSDSAAAERSELERRRTVLRPNWLQWNPPPQTDEQIPLPVAEAAERTRPRVLASFTNGVPFLIQRRYGNGRVLLVSTGFSMNWSSIALTNAMLVFDRITRELIESTFPHRTLTTDDQRIIPIPVTDRHARFICRGPNGYEPSLSPEPIGRDRYGVIVQRPPHRGLYRVTQVIPAGARVSADAKPWEVTLAANGPAEASELVAPDSAGLTAAAESVWAPKGSAQLAEAPGLGRQDLWRWLLTAVLLGLLLELSILAWPALRRARAT